MTKATYTEISVIVYDMTEATYQANGGTYAFAAGYLSSMVAQLIVDLPKHKQLEAIRNIQATTLKYSV
jgi:hypothetical protein